MSEPRVYIMTPVYNGEAYLRECIESVLAQTYSNWIYTIVNNCSTDRTREIAEEYSARDRRIRVVNNASFLRLIENHNRAYSLIPSDSKYCKPLMADDWIFPECLSEMVRVAEDYPSIGLVCILAFDGRDVVWQAPPEPGPLISGRDICRAWLLGGRHVIGSPTTQLIRADLIRKRPQFNSPFNLHADFESCLDILQESDFGFVHRVLAFNRVHQRSMTSQVEAFETILLGDLIASLKFGPVFLTPEENSERLASVFARYYKVLAKNLVRRRGRQFWRLHRRKLHALGYSLETTKLTKALTRELLCRFRVYLATKNITAHIPEGDSFILVDQEEWKSEDYVAGRRRVPFLERDGRYWGTPADDATAIRELERLREGGARYMVFAWPAFWWLAYYAGLQRHLDSEYECVLKNNTIVVFNLQKSAAKVH